MQDQPSNSAPPTTPDLPDHFDQEARLQFLYSFLNPDIDQFRVADLAGLKLSEYFAYINSEEFQQRLAQQTSIAEQRARACATLAQPKAVATLQHIIDSYNEAERDILLGRQPIALNIRQRHRESARRASWLILKLTGAIPPSLAARAKAFKESCAEPLERAESRSLPAFLQRPAAHAPTRATQSPTPSCAPLADPFESSPAPWPKPDAAPAPHLISEPTSHPASKLSSHPASEATSNPTSEPTPNPAPPADTSPITRPRKRSATHPRLPSTAVNMHHSRSPLQPAGP